MKINWLNKQVLFCFLFLFIISCTNSDDDPIVPDNAVFEAQTELISLTGSSEALTLTWKPVVIPNFVRYKVYRYEYHTNANINQGIIIYAGELIFETTNNLTTTYLDNQVPFNAFVHYAIVTEYINEESFSTTAYSINYLSYENENLSFLVTSLEKLPDGTLKLTWEQDANTSFQNYTIARIDADGVTTSENIFTTGSIVTTLTNQQLNTTIDNTQHKSSTVSYAVAKVINGKTIYSKNYLSIANPRSLNFKPEQTLKNPYNENEIIIIGRNGEIVFYDTVSLSQTTIINNGENFFCSIGERNGTFDLYVPSSQAKLVIIDLITHSIKETIQLNTDTEYNIISAIPIDNHILFLEKHRFATIGGMFVYNPANQQVINRTGIYSMSDNSKLVFGQDNYFFNIWHDGLEYGTLSAISRLNINGNNVTVDLLFSGSKTDSRLFALSQDKSYFVSTNLGYQSTVDYQNFTETTTEKYAQSQFFGDAKIDENNQIYFSLPNEYRIEVFQKDNFNTTINQFPTSGIPLFIEVLDTKIISFNQVNYNFYIQTIPK